MRAACLSAAVLTCVSLAAPASGQWNPDGVQVGDTVVVVADQAVPLKDGPFIVGTVGRGKQLRVEGVDEGRYLVRWNGNRGWIRRSNVVPAGQGIEHFTKTLRRFPDPRDFVARGRLWADQEEYRSAFRDFDSAIQVNPAWAPTYDVRGSVRYGRGEYAEALRDFDEALRLNPWLADAQNNKARLLSSCPDAGLRDGRRAVEFAQAACEATLWREASHLATLAAAHAEAGDFEKAVTWQSRALELAPPGDESDHLARLRLFEQGRPYRDRRPDRRG